MISAYELSWVSASYCLGCFTTGYYWVLWRQERDLRHLGTGSTGARNVRRVAGPTGWWVTVVGDVLKGAAAVGVPSLFHMAPEVQAASLVAVVLGHNWPVQLHFSGGKGVAVSMGALAIYCPWVPLMIALLLLPFWSLTRRLTLSGLLAIALVPILMWLLRFDPLQTLAMSLTSMVILIAHHKNIREDLAALFLPPPETDALAHRSP